VIRRRTLLEILLGASAALFLVGAFAPLLSVSRFVVLTDQFSLVTGIAELVRRDEVFLAILIGAFSGVAPLVKLGGLWASLAPRGISPRALSFLEQLGRWSMLEVFVVALLVVTVKLKGLASADVHWGAYALAGSAMLALAASALAVPGSATGRPLRVWPAFAVGLCIGGASGIAAFSLADRIDLPALMRLAPSASARDCIERVLAGVRESSRSADGIGAHAEALAAMDTAGCPGDFRQALGAHALALRQAAEVEATEHRLMDTIDGVTAFLLRREPPAEVSERQAASDRVESSWEAVEAAAVRAGAEPP